MSTFDRPAPGLAIDVRNVSKWFKFYHDPAAGPAKAALYFWKRSSYYTRFPAVQNVSFSARRGEIIGIIGPNGAGKTTLLKMIAGLLPVDEGIITVQGKISALLALGLGIHPEFSGRENIFYCGLLMGMSRQEIAAKTPEIIEFSELGNFIDHPFRTYSSGMRARLLFSISMSVNPDIMIIDEALATGDNYFVQKCQRKIKEICESGATVIFVSHNLYQIGDITDRCIYIKKGKIAFDGASRSAVDIYIDDIHAETSEKLETQTLRSRTTQEVKGTGEIKVCDAYLMSGGIRTNQIFVGAPVELHMEIESLREIKNCTFGVDLLSGKSLTTYAFLQLFDFADAEIHMQKFDLAKGRSKIVLYFDRMLIGDGTYHATIEFYSAEPDYRYAHQSTYCRCENYLSFHAAHKNKRIYGRGTLCEVPVSRVEMIPLGETPSNRQGAS